MVIVMVLLIVVLFGGLAVVSMALFKSSKKPVPGSKHVHPTILVIDDNISVLKMIRIGLEEDYTVLTASNPQQGIELFKQRSRDISLVLLDFRMPEMSGDQVFDCLQKINSEVPVLLITGFCEDMEAAQQLQKQVYGYLIKPFRLGDLIGKVREVVSLN